MIYTDYEFDILSFIVVVVVVVVYMQINNKMPEKNALKLIQY